MQNKKVQTQQTATQQTEKQKDNNYQKSAALTLKY